MSDRWTESDYQAYLVRQGPLWCNSTPPECPPQTPDDMPESALLRHVRALAKRYGWLLYHTHDSRNSEAGFPDCVLTNGTRVFWVELKSATGKMTEEQALWIEMLRHAGQEVFIWRPADRPNIEALLRGGAQ